MCKRAKQLGRLGWGLSSAIVIAAHAATWNVAPRVEMSETYVDNVTLAPFGYEEQDFVSQVSPAVKAEAKGRHMNLGMDYTMQNVLFGRQSDRNTVFHQADADFSAELAEGVFFLDGKGLLIQQPRRSDERIALDNLSGPSNRADVGMLSVSPYAQRRFGTTASAVLRYRLDYTNYADTVEADSTNQGFFADIKSGDRFERYGWGFSYGRRNITFGDGRENVLEKTTAELAYKASRRLTLTVNGGYDNNELEGQQIASESWSTGGKWSPTSQTTLNMSTGQRIFGSSTSLAFSQRLRHYQMSVSYSEDFSSAAENLLQSQTAQTPKQSVGIPNTTDVLAEIYLLRRLSSDLAVTTKKSRLVLSAYGEERDYQVSDTRDRTYGTNAAWEWRFAARAKSLVNASVQLRDPQASAWNVIGYVSLALERRIRRNITGSLDYKYTRQETKNSPYDYDQSRITASLKAAF